MLHFENILDIDELEFKNQTASFYKFEDFTLKSKRLCQFDLVFENNIIVSNKIIHQLKIVPVDNECFESYLQITTENMDSSDLYEYMQKLWNFSTMASFIMTIVLYNIL